MEGVMTVCPVCASQNQSVFVGPRVRGSCYECGATWEREGTTVTVVTRGEGHPEAAVELAEPA